MTWIQKELKRRATAKAREISTGATLTGAFDISQTPSIKISELWDILEAENSKLPPELRLERDENPLNSRAPESLKFRALLRAPNGASIGFTGEIIRYDWPQQNSRKSYNFWISWRANCGYFFARRIGMTIPIPNIRERRFDEESSCRILKCLVTGVRVSDRRIRKRRLWLF